MNRSLYYDQLEHALSLIVTRLQIRGKKNLTNLHIHAENFLREFLNALYGLKLINVNRRTPNKPAIDLRDDSNRVLIQISTLSNYIKVQTSMTHDSLQPFRGYRFLYISLNINDMAILRDKIYSNPHGFKFDAPTDILNVNDLLNDFNEAEIARQSEIMFLIEQELQLVHKYFSLQKVSKLKKRLWSFGMTMVTLFFAIIFFWTNSDYKFIRDIQAQLISCQSPMCINLKTEYGFRKKDSEWLKMAEQDMQKQEDRKSVLRLNMLNLIIAYNTLGDTIKAQSLLLEMVADKAFYPRSFAVDNGSFSISHKSITSINNNFIKENPPLPTYTEEEFFVIRKILPEPLRTQAVEKLIETVGLDHFLFQGDVGKNNLLAFLASIGESERRDSLLNKIQITGKIEQAIKTSGDPRVTWARDREILSIAMSCILNHRPGGIQKLNIEITPQDFLRLIHTCPPKEYFELISAYHKRINNFFAQGDKKIQRSGVEFFNRKLQTAQTVSRVGLKQQGQSLFTESFRLLRHQLVKNSFIEPSNFLGLNSWPSLGAAQELIDTIIELFNSRQLIFGFPIYERVKLNEHIPIDRGRTEKLIGYLQSALGEIARAPKNTQQAIAYTQYLYVLRTMRIIKFDFESVDKFQSLMLMAQSICNEFGREHLCKMEIIQILLSNRTLPVAESLLQHSLKENFPEKQLSNLSPIQMHDYIKILLYMNRKDEGESLLKNFIISMCGLHTTENAQKIAPWLVPLVQSYRNFKIAALLIQECSNLPAEDLWRIKYQTLSNYFLVPYKSAFEGKFPISASGEYADIIFNPLFYISDPQNF